MAQAARYLEGRGFSTIVLTPMPEFHNQVGIPRSAAVAYPFGRLFGQPGDRAGQRRVLLALLDALANSRTPGEVHHLPFQWPEEPRKAEWQPSEMSPLVKHFLKDIKEARRREQGIQGSAER